MTKVYQKELNGEMRLRAAREARILAQKRLMIVKTDLGRAEHAIDMARALLEAMDKADEDDSKPGSD